MCQEDINAFHCGDMWNHIGITDASCARPLAALRLASLRALQPRSPTPAAMHSPALAYASVPSSSTALPPPSATTLFPQPVPHSPLAMYPPQVLGKRPCAQVLALLHSHGAELQALTILFDVVGERDAGRGAADFMLPFLQVLWGTVTRSVGELGRP